MAGVTDGCTGDALLPDPSPAPQINIKNQLNTMNGCYIPCLLNILGAVLFLRVGFAVGMMGFWGALGIFAFSECIAYLTITSFSAIVTNGRMAGGGAYYMISRNLGPAFGGSSGLMFWFTYCLNVTFNTVSFTETFQETFFTSDSWWGRTDNWSQTAISTITLFLLFLVAYKGAGAFAKINWFIFAGLCVALAASIGSLFFHRVSLTLPAVTYTDPSGQDHEYHGTFTPWNWDTLRNNMFPDPVASEQCEQAAMFGSGSVAGKPCSLQLVFSVIFPAVVGMMEGANLSGDLKNPGHSIPVGTLAAVSTAFCCYILLIIGQSGTMSREALQFDMNVMQHSTIGNGYFVVLGVATACLSTALGSMFGSARILQAIARDDIFPGLGFFKVGSAHGDEPRRAIVISYLLAEAGILLGGLDDVAPILTNFFLLAYFLVNVACFLLIVSKVPNFRPTFRCYSWPTSLLGSVMIIIVMFYLNWIYALFTLLLVSMLYLFVTYRFRGRNDWIDISQAVLFRWSRRGLLTIQAQKQDPKFWRPSLLLLLRAVQPTEEPDTKHLVSFLNCMKESGLFVIGQALIGVSSIDVQNNDKLSIHNETYAQLSASLPSLQAFPQLAIGQCGRTACLNLLLSAGLGSMVPDTVAMALPCKGAFSPGVESSLPVDSPKEFLEVMQDVLQLKKNILLAANFCGISAQGGDLQPRVDMWLFGDVSAPLSGVDEPELLEKTQLSLLLQIGMICRSQGIHKNSRRPRLRLLNALPGSAYPAGAIEAQEAVLNRWFHWARIPRSDVKVVSAPKVPSRLSAESSEASFESVNEQILLESRDADLVIMMLPSPPTNKAEMESGAYLQNLSVLTAGLPPTILSLNGQGFPVITTVI